MELDDCAFPLLAGMSLHDDPVAAFRDTNWCLLVGSKPRGPGMERADLLKDNGKIFVGQGDAIDQVAAEDCRVTVVGNPCNTNAMICASRFKRLSPDVVTAMTRLDENRAAHQLAAKAGVPVTEVADIFIYGNHSPTMYPDFVNATIGGKPATGLIGDRDWLEKTYIPTVGKRGAAIIEARGLSSAASAANALVDHVRNLVDPDGRLHSMAVKSRGEYGFTEGIWASMPVLATGDGTYEVDTSFKLDAFGKERIGKTNAELVSERETVQPLMA